MKRIIPAALAAFLLCSCTQAEMPAEETTATVSETEKITDVEYNETTTAETISIAETSSLSVSAESDSITADTLTIPHETPHFYGKDMPPCFMIEEEEGEPLNYRIFFIIDGEIREAQWYIDGEKQDSINYTLLYMYGTDEGFNAYSPFGDEFIKYSFTFDIDTLTFEGVSERPVQTEHSETAQKLLDDCYAYIMGAYTQKVGHDGELLTEGYRTRDELMDGLERYCEHSAAEALLEQYFDDQYGDFYEKDGRMHIIDEAWSNMPPTYYVDMAQENNGLITARIYSYGLSQDIPHYISPPKYAAFEYVDGEWKIITPPEIYDETVCYY